MLNNRFIVVEAGSLCTDIFTHRRCPLSKRSEQLVHLMNINHMHVTGAIILVEEWMERMVREYSFFKLNATFLSLSIYIYSSAS